MNVKKLNYVEQTAEKLKELLDMICFLWIQNNVEHLGEIKQAFYFPLFYENGVWNVVHTI